MILRVLIFLMATAAAGGAAWLSAQTGAHSAPPPVEVLSEAPTVEVLVAGVDISGGEVLSPDRMQWDTWPETTVTERFITKKARPDAMQELSGTFVNSGFAAGEPIREARLMATNKNLMSNKIEPGKRAAAVKVSAESAAGGFILPGDRVDVIHTLTREGANGGPVRNESRIIISNARVLAIDQTSAQTPEGTFVGKTATLELSPVEAELIMAADASGALSLALRSVADHAAREPITPEKSAPTVLIRRRGESSIVTVR